MNVFIYELDMTKLEKKRKGEQIFNESYLCTCTEVKYDPRGNKIPWIDRKHEYLRHLASASLLTKLIVLADKIHNMQSTINECIGGPGNLFRSPEETMWFYQSVFDAVKADTDVVINFPGVVNTYLLTLTELKLSIRECPIEA